MAEHFKCCPRCGQIVITHADVVRCATCAELERRPQGESMRLFAPAPAQLEGQTYLELEPAGETDAGALF